MSRSNPAPPADVASDPDAVEILRAWVSRGQAIMTVRPAFANPAALGQLLASIAREGATAYASVGAMAEAEAHTAILSGWTSQIGADGSALAREGDR